MTTTAPGPSVFELTNAYCVMRDLDAAVERGCSQPSELIRRWLAVPVPLVGSMDADLHVRIGAMLVRAVAKQSHLLFPELGDDVRSLAAEYVRRTGCSRRDS